MIVIRASATDRALDCSGSILPAEHPYEPQHNEARGGQALHEVMAQHVSEGGADVDRYAREFDVELDELAFLYSRGRKALELLGQQLPKPHVEHAMTMLLAPGVELRGKSDVVSVTETEDGILRALAVVDWKAGYVQRQHAGQVRSYALLWRAQFLDHMPATGFVLGVEAWLRLGKLEVRHITADDLQRHRDALIEQMRRAEGHMGGVKYGPGEACTFCPRQQVCAAREEWIRASLAPLERMGANVPVTAQALAAALPRVRQFEAFARQYYAALDHALAVSNGRIDLGDGEELRVVEHEQDAISAKALPVLQKQGFTPDEIERCTRVSKGALLEIVGEKSPHGSGAANKRRVMSTLRDAGAVDRLPRREKVIQPIEEKKQS